MRNRRSTPRELEAITRLVRKALANNGTAIGVDGLDVVLLVGVKKTDAGIQMLHPPSSVSCPSIAVAEAVVLRFWRDFVSLNQNAEACGQHRVWGPQRSLDQSLEYELAQRRVAHRRMGRRFE